MFNFINNNHNNNRNNNRNNNQKLLLQHLDDNLLIEKIAKHQEYHSVVVRGPNVFCTWMENMAGSLADCGDVRKRLFDIAIGVKYGCFGSSEEALDVIRRKCDEFEQEELVSMIEASEVE